MADGSIPAVHGGVRWWLNDLARWVYEEFGVSLDETTVGCTLRAMGFRKLSAQPRHHARNELVLEDLNSSILKNVWPAPDLQAALR